MDVKQDVLIVSFDNKSSDIPMLLTGRQKNGKVEVLTLIQGEEAIEIYKKLVTWEGKTVDSQKKHSL